MYILLQRYHLLHLLANNTGPIAVNNTARTSARLDKSRIAKRWRVIPERSAGRLQPCLPLLGLQEAQEEAGMCHVTPGWARRCSKVPMAPHPRVKANACSLILLALAGFLVHKTHSLQM